MRVSYQSQTTILLSQPLNYFSLHHHHHHHHTIKPKPLPHIFPNTVTLSLKPNKLQFKLNSVPKHSQSIPFPILLPILTPLTPYLRSQTHPILLAWLFSSLSVLSLSQIVPRVTFFTSNSFHFTKLLELTLFVVLRSVATYLQQTLLWNAALNVVTEIRVDVFSKVLERELGFFEGGAAISAGDIAYRLTAEASDLAETIYALLNAIVPNFLQLTAMAAQMLVISPVLSSMAVVMIPCMALVIAYLGERVGKLSKTAHLTSASLSAYLNEVLPAILFVKANSAESCESARFKGLVHADRLERSLLVSSGSLDGGKMVSFVTSLLFLIDPIQGVGKAYNELKQGEPAMERLFDLTSVKCKVLEQPNAVDLDHVTGDVKFCDLYFGYGDNKAPILNGLNLHVNAGETIAFVGPSGGGKTTLIKLLLRLYDPLAGCILVDGRNIQNIKLDSLRRHVALVSQDTTIFSGTVAENIGYRDLMTKIDMERVELAAQTANADEFIKVLPKGYYTNVGPRGSSLSGGQKQRLAIARAVYQNASILILDEATSALDSRSELLVRQALERLMETHTVLVIAHRLETVLMANRVFLLDHGKLAELTREDLRSSQLNNF
ncbi:hypothetical protein ACFE04_002702 [Oxalis oulophora]